MCLDEQIINSYVDGELKEPWKSQVKQHIESCEGCKKIYEKYKNLSFTISEQVLDNDQINKSKARVFEYVEQNKGKNSKFFRRQISVNLPMMVTAAAAFVIVFVGAFFFLGNTSMSSENIPSIELNQNASLVPVSNTEKDMGRPLSSYSVEELVQELDRKGFTVNLKLKPIEVDNNE